MLYEIDITTARIGAGPVPAELQELASEILAELSAALVLYPERSARLQSQRRGANIRRVRHSRQTGQQALIDYTIKRNGAAGSEVHRITNLNAYPVNIVYDYIA